MGGSTLMRLDPDGLRYVATILVWAHWFVVAFSFVQLAYRPPSWPERISRMRRYPSRKGRGKAGTRLLRQVRRRSGVI